jgi:hypothetical protein
MEAISANDYKRAENGAGNTVLFPARFAFVSRVEKRSRDFGRRADKKRKTRILRVFLLAEKEGFEPSRPFRGLHDFQSCALDQLGDFSIAVKN